LTTTKISLSNTIRELSRHRAHAESEE